MVASTSWLVVSWYLGCIPSWYNLLLRNCGAAEEVVLVVMVPILVPAKLRRRLPVVHSCSLVQLMPVFILFKKMCDRNKFAPTRQPATWLCGCRLVRTANTFWCGRKMRKMIQMVTDENERILSGMLRGHE